MKYDERNLEMAGGIDEGSVVKRMKPAVRQSLEING
jgi:hypothetical protein